MERSPCSQELTKHLDSIENSIIFQFGLEDRKHECLRHGDVDACHAMDALFEGLKFMNRAKAETSERLGVCLASQVVV